MNIGNKIKKIKELRNVTQEYMAIELGISQEGYSKIEADKTKITLERVEKIAKILQMDILDLLSFDEKFVFNNFSNPQQKQRIKNIFGGQNNENEKELYERIIEELKTEVAFLRSILKDKM
jgi:transcriptional regulator with XRE-family HTH domain